MGRDLRFVPPDSLQHVTDVTFQNRRLLQPCREVNLRFLGILGRAQRKYEMEICAVVVMSTHVHYLLRPRDALHLSAFMSFVKTNVAKEIGGRLRGWQGGFFGGRYHSTTVSDEEAAQVAVLRYILGHGVKENLVDKVEEWPGIHSAVSTVEGRDMVGRWVDRTSASNAGIRDDEKGIEPFATEERVVISPLPCWRDMPEGEWRGVVGELVDEIDREAAETRAVLGKSSLGAENVSRAKPHHRSERVEKSAKPRFHARDPRVLRAMTEAWREVIRCFREASKRLRSGIVDVVFPEGTFPPSLPFVPFSMKTRMAIRIGGLL